MHQSEETVQKLKERIHKLEQELEVAMAKVLRLQSGLDILAEELPQLADGSPAVPGMLVFDPGCRHVDNALLEPHVTVNVTWIDDESGTAYIDETDDWYPTRQAAMDAENED